MPENPTLPKPEQVFGSKSLPSPNQVFNAPAGQSAYEQALSGQTGIDKFKQIIANIPDMDEGKKKIVEDVALRGLRGKELSDVILTLQGKHPHQEGNTKYYLDDKGVPKPLKNSERPPIGHEVASIWGTQKEANDDAWYTDLAKTVYNVLPATAENVIDLAQTGYELATNKESEYLNTLKNSANYLKMAKDEDLNKSLFNTQGIDEWKDLTDKERWDFSPETVWGTVNSLLGSVGEFAAGGAGAAKIAGKATKATQLIGSVLTNLGEVRDAATEAGLTGRDRAIFTAAVAPIVSAVDVKWGLANKIVNNPAAEAEKKSFLKALGKGLAKDAEGKFTKEALDELPKMTTVGYAQVAKQIGKLTTKDVLQEGGQEAAQAFIQNAGEQLWDKLTPDEKKKFGTDAFSPESFGEYIQNGLAGLIGGAPTVVAVNQARQLAKNENQDLNAFELAKKGETAINAFKQNVDLAVKNGTLSPQEGANAVFKVEAFKQYHNQLGDVKMPDEDKFKVLRMSFEKANLESQIPTKYEEEKLNPIEQAKIDVKRKEAKALQDEITNLVQRHVTLNKETIASEKTVGNVDKGLTDENEPTEPGKVKISKGVADLAKKWGMPAEEIKPTETKQPSTKLNYQGVAFEDITPLQWNERKHRDSERFKYLVNKLTTENDVMPGNLFLPEDSSTYDTIKIELPGQKFVSTASSARDLNTQVRGHFRTERAGENIHSVPVVIKPIQLTTGRTVLGVYSEENGKFLSYVREHDKGKSQYSEKEIEELQHMQAASKLYTSELAGYKAKREEYAKAKPKAQARAKEKFEPVQPTEQPTKQPETKEKVSKKDAIRDRALQIKSKVENYNALSRAEKKSEQGQALYRSIVDSANEIEHTIEIGNKGKLSLKTPKGKKVHRTPVKRPDDVIKAEKYEKDKQRRALRMVPQSIKHLVMLDVANGERFNQGELETLLQTKVEGGNIPSLFVQKKGGISFEFYKQRLAEMMGVETDSLPGDETQYTQEAIEALKPYLHKDGRDQAIKDAVIIYEKSVNDGLTDAELKEMQERNNVTPEEANAINNMVNEASEKEVDESLNKLKDEKNQTEQTANEIAHDLTGEENPFKGIDDESEGESDEDSGIITDGPDDAFQKESTKKGNINTIVETLQKAMPKVKVEFDDSIDAAGRWSSKNNTITINPYYAGLDTPIHEYAHVFIDAIGLENKVIKAAVEQLKNTQLWADTKNRYPELDENNLAKEVLAEAIGLEGANIFDKESEKSQFMKYLEYIYNWLKNKLGLNKNTVNSLAKQILAGIGTKEMMGEAQGKTVSLQLPSGEKINGVEVMPEVVNGFYSKLEKQLLQMKLDKAPAKQWNDKLKSEEAKWTGLSDWLASKEEDAKKFTGKTEIKQLRNGKFAVRWKGEDGATIQWFDTEKEASDFVKGNVTRQEIKDFLKNNRISLVEVTKGEKKKPANTIVAKLGVGGRNTSYTFYYVDGYGETSKLETVENLYTRSAQEAFDRWVEDGGGVEEMADFYDINQDEFTLFDSEYDEGQETKYHQYQLPGEAENYRELLITMPSKVNEKRLQELIQKKRNRTITKAEEKEFNELDKKVAKDFQSSHWDEPNILVHLRMNERTDTEGNKVLFLEEVQSDWGQEGKKKGFIQPRVKPIISKVREDQNIWVVYYEDGSFVDVSKSDAKNMSEAMSYATKNYNELTKYKSVDGKVQPAPFITDTNAWVKLGLKYALKQAVESGATKIAWTTGEQQNERYDLSKQVDEIVYFPTKENDIYDVTVLKNDKQILAKHMDLKEIESTLGKDIADKIQKGEGVNRGGLADDDGIKSLMGLDLKVGGKGMKGFYDKILPDVFKSLVKELTGKSGEVGSVDIFTKGKVTTKNTTVNKALKAYQLIDKNGDILSSMSLETGDGFSKEDLHSELVYLANKHSKKLDTNVSQMSVEITPELAKAVGAGMPMFQKNKSKQRSEEEVRPIFEQLMDLFYQSKDAETSKKKRILAEQRRDLLKNNPDIAYIDKNIKSIYRQLKEAGELMLEGDCE